MKKKSNFRVTEADPPDFELVFHSHGSVELFDADGRSVWQSDADDDFADEFEGDFFGMDEDGDEILDYLDEIGKIDLDDHDIEMIENDLADDADDSADGNVIDGKFREVRGPRK